MDDASITTKPELILVDTTTGELKPTRAVKALGWLALVILVVVSVVYLSLAYIDFDEGFNLQAPSSLARDGRYATRYDGGMLFDPAITTGPTVLIPIAAVFKIAGEGYIQARVIPLLFFIALGFVSFHLTRRLYGLTAAVIACGLTFAAPDIFRFGLRALGEAPSLVFLFAGLLVMSKRRGFLAGCLLGCAALTKFITILALFPVGLLWIGSAFTARHRWRQYSGVLLGAVVVMGIWEAVQLVSVGTAGYAELKWRFVNMILGGGGSAAAMAGSGLKARGGTLTDAFGGIGIWNGVVILAAALYSFVSINSLIRKEKHSDVRFVLAVFTALFTFWWFFTNNMGWWRHYLPGYLALAPAMAAMTSALFHQAAGKPGFASSAAGFTAIIVMMTMIGMPAFGNLHEAITGASGFRLTEQKRFAEKIKGYQNNGGLVAGWGWHQAPDISFLTGRVLLNAAEPDIRAKMDSAVKGGKNAYLVVTPVQTASDPGAWAEERRWANDLVTLNGGYRVYEFLPDDAFDRQVDLILQREQWEMFSTVYTPGNPDIDRAQRQGGLMADGWMGKYGAIWLRSPSGLNQADLNVENPADGIGDSVTIQLFVQNQLMETAILKPGEKRTIAINLEDSNNVDNLVKIGIMADRSFVPSSRKPAKGDGIGSRIKALLGVSSFDHRDLSVKVHRIELK